MEYYQLADGQQLPKLGFGTGGMGGDKCFFAVQNALQNGYRFFDTAYNSGNQGAVGAAIRASEVPRAQLQVSSKLPGRAFSRQSAFTIIKESLWEMGLDYFDVYLLHWPNPMKDQYVEAWQALIDAQQLGLLKSIGVSNFLPEHLERLQQETGVLPVVNELPLNPGINQAKSRAYAAKHHIQIMNWASLGGWRQHFQAVPELQAIAQAHGVSVASVVLRWEVQLNTLPMTRSTNVLRQQENLAVLAFELSPEEMAQIARLQTAESLALYPDPNVYEHH